jgi:hypothetical protein
VVVEYLKIAQELPKVGKVRLAQLDKEMLEEH